MKCKMKITNTHIFPKKKLTMLELEVEKKCNLTKYKIINIQPGVVAKYPKLAKKLDSTQKNYMKFEKQKFVAQPQEDFLFTIQHEFFKRFQTMKIIKT
jgi:hypothetical protein